MPAIDTRLYKDLIGSLEKMAEGISANNSGDLPIAAEEDIIRSAIKRINSLKNAYEESEAQTKRFYHLYLQEIKNARKEYGRLKMMLYCFYGKNNKIVESFGLKLYK